MPERDGSCFYIECSDQIQSLFIENRMQPLIWYFQRLKTMSPSELVWRFRSELRDVIDWIRFPLGLYPSFKTDVVCLTDTEFAPGFSVSDMKLGEWASEDASEDEKKWYKRLINQADKIVEHKFSFFDLQDYDLGDPIDWNCDHGNGKKAPLGFAPFIDYRNFQVTGDCKLVWEPNRHHQLVVLGRAYRAGGNIKYAEAVKDQLDSWLQQCPFGKGMNWRSPLELSIRLINWVWALDLIRDSGLFIGDFRKRILHSAYLHLWEVTRKYSRGSSANNHLVGEAAGVFIATSYFQKLANASKWCEESRKILSREIISQSYPDGCTREQAIGYQLFVLQFFIFSGIIARLTKDDFPPEFWSRIEKMLEFVGILTEGGDTLSMFGDSDDGYVLDLGNSHSDSSALLSIGAVLFERSDFKAWSADYAEPARWLLGRSSREQFCVIDSANFEPSHESVDFSDSGYYLLQCGSRGSPDRVSVLFDCGELGFKSTAAHGHADALSFTLRAFGIDIFVDPGTYDYFSFPEWRDYFRSTRAHNTVEVDGVDQSVMLGPFMWGRRAQARCVKWEPREEGGKVVGEHNGYMRISDPVMHRRTLELDPKARIFTIHDKIMARKSHKIKIYFHLSEACVPANIKDNRCEITVAGKTVTLEIDPQLFVGTLTGSQKPIGGWVSRGYHCKEPATTIIGYNTNCGNVSFVCRIAIGKAL